MRGYPDGKFDLLSVVEGDFFFEVAGVDGGLLLVIEFVFDVLEGDGSFTDSA